MGVLIDSCIAPLQSMLHSLVLCVRSRSVNKALSLIQIEERAISELEKVYSAAENPDEYIVVKRCSKKSLEQDLGKLPLNSPWSREL